MIPDDPPLETVPGRRAVSLAAARALLVPPESGLSSPWPALGSAFAAACAALIAAAAVILAGPSLGDPSHAVYAPVRHIGDV